MIAKPNENTLTLDGRTVVIRDERNLLEVARGAGIEIPTFCYHSDLSVYGACRLCLVDVEGMGVVASCSTAPQPGMVVRIRTEEIREMRKIAVELLLANHDQSCPTCPKSASCKLQDLARRLGVEEVRFKKTHQPQPVDRTTPSLVRDPNKCILCGDCVRACHEIQAIGAIDFAHRGAHSCVAPAFGKDLGGVECVYCGQCAAVCPTGALTPKTEIDAVWKALADPKKKVVAQIAPAVRVAMGEMFGLEPGTVNTGQTIAALKAIGFDRVYDTSFAADLTVIEEGTEFLDRKEKGERLPQFTSCCPAWVKFAEQYFPSLLPNLSTCRSPQQMLGSLARKVLPEELAAAPEDIVMVSIMPCTAKKYEAGLEKFQTEGRRDVDHVLTTQELGRMIEEAGLDFKRLEPASLDMLLGFRTGAGILFGSSGGVTEAVLRFAVEQVDGVRLDNVDFEEVRGEAGLREATVTTPGGTELRLAVVHGLANARRVAERVVAGEAEYDLIEVMSCPGGCIAGAGQPVCHDPAARRARAQGLYNADKMVQLHKSQDNHMVQMHYRNELETPGSAKAHEMLHTHYRNRRRILDQNLTLLANPEGGKVRVGVCVGTSCFVRGSQELLRQLIAHVESNDLAGMVDVEATFCMEQCGQGPTVAVGNRVLERCTFDAARLALEEELKLTNAGA